MFRNIVDLGLSAFIEAQCSTYTACLQAGWRFVAEFSVFRLKFNTVSVSLASPIF